MNYRDAKKYMTEQQFEMWYVLLRIAAGKDGETPFGSSAAYLSGYAGWHGLRRTQKVLKELVDEFPYCVKRVKYRSHYVYQVA